MKHKPARRISRSEIDKLVRAMKTAQPTVTKDQLNKLELAFVDRWGVVRRTAVAVLTVSGAHLIKEITANRRTALSFARLNKQLESYRAFLKEYLTMLESAGARLDMALCFRADMKYLLSEAEPSPDQKSLKRQSHLSAKRPRTALQPRRAGR